MKTTRAGWAIGVAMAVATLSVYAEDRAEASREGARANETADKGLPERTEEGEGGTSRCYIGKAFYTEEERAGDPGFKIIWPLQTFPFPPPDELKRFILRNPRSEAADEILLRMGERFVKEGGRKEAARTFARIVEYYPKSALVDANMMLHSVSIPPPPDLYERQERRLEAHLMKYPDFTADVALMWMAVLESRRGNRAKAIALLEPYVRDHPKGRWAAEDAKVYTDVKPFTLHRTDQVIFFQLAWFYYDAEDYANAVKVLKQGIDAFINSPNLPAFHELLALTYMKMGDTSKELPLLRHTPARAWYCGDISGLTDYKLADTKTFIRNEYWWWPQIRTSEQIAERRKEIESEKK